MSKPIEYTKSSGNVFTDLGLPNSEEQLQTAINTIMNEQSDKELRMSDEELENLYRIEVYTPQQLGVSRIYVVNFFSKDAPANSPVVHIQLEDDADSTFLCVNRPTDADKTKYGALWDNRYVPLAQKHIVRQMNSTQEVELAAA